MIPAYSPYNSDQSSNVPVVNSTSPSASATREAPTPIAADNSKMTTFIPMSKSRVLLVLNQLSVMSQNGVDLAEALGNVAQFCSDKRLARSLTEIHHAVSSGSTLSGAIAMYGHYFPPTLAPMIAAAEATGEVPETLGKVVDRMRGELEMRGTILGAMIYPMILIGASGIVMSALILGVLPQFSKVFASMGRPVPMSTRLLLDFGDCCRTYWMFIVPAVLAAFGTLVAMRRHPWIRNPIARFFMYGPMISSAYRPLATGRNFRTIAGMVRNGVPLLQAVRLTRRATNDRYWHALLGHVEAKLIDGLPASSALAGIDFLPPEAMQMMATGERTGRVGEVLEDIGSFYEQEGGRKLKRLVVALEPVIILIMGVIVAGIVMSVMLPLLDVSTMSR